MAEREANRVARETNTRIDMDMNVVEPEKPKVNWYPPGADASGEQRTFTDAVDEAFEVPDRLADKSGELVESVNDWHYAMINDHPRNEFYKKALEHSITPETTVLEIGTGSGLLSIIAASVGARRVVAVEANKHLAQLARNIIAANGFSDRITVINKMSTEMTLEDMPDGEPADMIISEILGTLMLGESALEYIADARERLLKPGGVVIPNRGCQYAQLVSAADLEAITRVSSWGGIDLSLFNTLQDTVSIVFTKQYGFRFSSMAHTYMGPRICVADIDFTSDGPGVLDEPQNFLVQATESGTVHAVLLHWEVFAPGITETISTDPEQTRNNFPRDMQWGQALQLLEDYSAATDDESNGEGPTPLVVEQGQDIQLKVDYSEDSAVLCFQVSKMQSSTIGNTTS